MRLEIISFSQVLHFKFYFRLEVIDGGRLEIHQEIAISAASAIDVFEDESVITLRRRGRVSSEKIQEGENFGKNEEDIPGATSSNGPFLKRSTGLFDGGLQDAFGIETAMMSPLVQMTRHLKKKYPSQDWSKLDEDQLITAIREKVATNPAEEFVVGISKKTIEALRISPSAGGDDAPMTAAAAGRP